MSDTGELTDRIRTMLLRRIAGCTDLHAAERQSGGTGQETYRLKVSIDGEQRFLALRRANGGQYVEPTEGHPGLATEALLMQAAGQVGIPVPEIHYTLNRDDGLGDGIVMGWVDGEGLGAHIVRSDEFESVRPQLAYECGRILARLHAIDLDATGLRERLSVIQPERFIQRMWDIYQAIDTAQPMIDYTARWLMANVPEKVESTLVHSEFRNGNFMVTRDGIVAVLDWEEAHIGDPMRDFGWLCTNSWRYGGSGPVGGFGEYEDLFRGYEDVSGKAVDMERVHFWEVFGAFWWSVVSLDLANQIRSAETPSVERAVIGRRSSEAQIDCVNLIIPGSLENQSEENPGVGSDLPGTVELISIVSEFLRNEAMPDLPGRNSFLARVSANGLDMVTRELVQGPGQRRRERERLQSLLATPIDDLDELRWMLVRRLRNEEIAIEQPALIEHLRNTVAGQTGINQPRYSGFLTALENSQATIKG